MAKLVNIVPPMTSYTSPSGAVSYNGQNGTNYAYKAFDRNQSTFYGTYRVTNTWVSYRFPTSVKLAGYSIYCLENNSPPRSWVLEASNDAVTWDIIDTRNDYLVASWTSNRKGTFNIAPTKAYLNYRVRVTSNNTAEVINIHEIEFMDWVYDNKCLVQNSSTYKYYESGQWQVISGSPTEQDYLNYGMDDISIIPESAWSQLQGEVELCYYTDDPTKTEASFNIETEPFTLAEEWEDKEIKIIEYTDDPNQTESTITIETEPFTLYDELGDSVDVLYYTDDPSKTSTELNITANYSPLDVLEGDFDVVAWSDNNNPKTVQLSSIPSPQSVIQTDDYYMYGDLLSIVDKLNSTNGTLRYAVSFNEGKIWEVCKFGKWRTVDISNQLNFKLNGMSHYDISKIESKALVSKGDKVRFAYYIEDNIHNSEPGIEIDNVQLKIDAATDSVKFENLAFYVLNTNATIQLSIAGNKLLGVLDDSDRGKVQYRIFLNNKPYYPTDGNFTPLAPAPQDIDIKLSERDILFNQENIIKVEFQDYWGETDYWQTTFIGSYSGLMFMDETGEYLSDTFGGILKYLQFGEIYAGQTTIDQKVVIKNQLGYPVDEMLLTVNKDILPQGVGIELSRQQAPFLATDYITYGLTKENETQEFYVRITSDIDAEPVSNGIFELRINAKKT